MERETIGRVGRARRRALLLWPTVVGSLLLAPLGAQAQGDRRGELGEGCFPNGTCYEGLSCQEGTCRAGEPRGAEREVAVAGPNPWLGAGLELGGTCCGAVVCGLPAVGLAVATEDLEGVGGLVGLPLIPFGAAVGSALGGLVAELLQDGDMSCLRIFAPTVLAGVLGVAGALGAVGAGFAVGQLTESAVIGGASALVALVPSALLTGIAAGSLYAMFAFLATPGTEGTTVSVHTVDGGVLLGVAEPHEEGIAF